MGDLAKVALVGLGVLVLLPMIQRPMAQSSIPQSPLPAPYPTGGVTYPPAQSEYSGYGDLAAGIGTGLGSLFTGIGSLVNASQGSSYSGY